MSAAVALPSSVEVYRPGCERILGWLSNGWVGQRQFDRLAMDDLLADMPIRGPGSIMGAIILPSVMGNHQDHLALLQVMMHAGLVEGREGDDGIEYRAAEMPA